MIIPLPGRTAPLPNAAAPVLDRERRPSVDSRGQQQAIGRLADAQKQPEIPMSLAEQPGMAAIGRVLQEGGDMLGGLAIARQRAETKVQVTEADTEMQRAQVEFDTWRETNPNVPPSQWGKELDSRIYTARERVLGRQGLTPGAKEELRERFTRFEGLLRTNVQALADKTAFGQAKAAVLGDMENATLSGDVERFTAAQREGVSEGWLSDQEAEGQWVRFQDAQERKAKQAEADAKRIEYEVAAGDAITDPIAWLESNGEPWKGKETLWAQVKNIADARKNEGVGEFVGEMSDAIAAGDITVPEEIDAWESPFATPALKEEAKRRLASRDAFAEKQEREQNGVRNAVEYRQRVKAYDPAKDPDRTEYFGLVAEIGAKVEQSMAGEITGELFRKYGSEPPEVKVRPEIQRSVSKKLDAMFDPENGVIKWKSKQLVEGPDGKKRVELVEDPAARTRAIDAQTAVEMKMADFFKENPNATPAEVSRKVSSVLPHGLASAHFMNLKRKATPPPEGARQPLSGGVVDLPLPVKDDAPPSAKAGTGGASVGRVTSYGYRNDETPDSNSSAGIGAWVPKAEQAKIKRGEDSPYKLREGDIAVSPDIERAFRAAGVEPMGEVILELANGETRRARWMDRTAQDSDITSGRIKGVSKPLRGRFDFYSPGGKQAVDGMHVVRWWAPGGGTVASR